MDGKRYWDLRASEVERRPGTVVALCEQPGLMVAPHWHAQAEVNYVLRGRMEYRMEGYHAVLGAGDLALFWGGMPHRVVDTDADTLYQVVHLPLFHFFRLRLSAELQRRIMRGATLVTDGPQAEDGFAFGRWGQALSSGNLRRVGHALDELLLRLERIELEPHRLIDIDSARPAPPDPADSPTLDSVRRMCVFIAANFRDDIDSAAIAAAADIHPNYAMTVFKRCTGLSLSAYVSLLRLSYAQALLADDGASVLQVALESGFGSLSAFNKCFRKKAGMTPSEFKREHRAVPSLTGT
ncbi:helix-turn-helix domain-containing protein [Rubellimicrobium roseum]|nr:helix-turn-helix domain-containing protein [Rubellimicrobium roseum]